MRSPKRGHREIIDVPAFVAGCHRHPFQLQQNANYVIDVNPRATVAAMPGKVSRCHRAGATRLT
jgi:hypothetical protein